MRTVESARLAGVIERVGWYKCVQVIISQYIYIFDSMYIYIYILIRSYTSYMYTCV